MLRKLKEQIHFTDCIDLIKHEGDTCVFIGAGVFFGKLRNVLLYEIILLLFIILYILYIFNSLCS